MGRGSYALGKLNSCFINYCSNLFQGTTLMELDKLLIIYQNIIPIIDWMTQCDGWSKFVIQKLYKALINISEEIQILLSSHEHIVCSNLSFYQNIINCKLYWEKLNSKFKKKPLVIKINHKPDNQQLYLDTMKPLQFGCLDISNKSRFIFKDNVKSKPNIKTLQRLMHELPSLKNNLPLSWSSSIFVRFDPNNINCLKCLIVGPEKTPYMNGIFEFDVFFPDTYPNSPPKVLLYTTGCGAVRFNPNLYNSGKVCLSLLGTWSGNEGESWITDSSTFLQVLVSIQSLILVDHPYFNEPGWERDMHTEKGKEASFDYNDNIRFQTLKWAIIDQYKNPVPGFESIIKTHIEMKKDEILDTINIWEKESIKFKEPLTLLKNIFIKMFE